jgi:hypothetical protein
MDVVLRYRGRSVTRDDVAFVRGLVEANPGASRRELSRQLCDAWDWRQPNGARRDLVCRGLMLALHRADLVELAPVRIAHPNPLSRRSRAAPAQGVDETPCTDLRELQPLWIRQVRRTADEPLFNGLVERYHYLGYVRPVGEHLKYLVGSGERPVACFAWGSAPRHLGPRDRHLGWSAQARKSNIRLVAYNSRFLILPWVRVAHLASHLLGRMARMLPGEWQRAYGHPVVFAETFVDPERFRGTCYRAANWVYLGRTTGRGKDDRTHRANRSLKDVLGLPLVRDWRAQLGAIP